MKCCDGNEIFGGDNHSIDCEIQRDYEVRKYADMPDDMEDRNDDSAKDEIGYDPEPNKVANQLWEAR